MGARSVLFIVAAIVVASLLGAGLLALSDARPTSTPTPTALPPPPLTTPASPTAEPTVAAPAPLDLARIEWQTLTEPFGGAEAGDIDGVLLDPTGRVVVWGERGRRPHVWTSLDLEAWSEAPLGGDPMHVFDLAAGARGMVAVGYIEDLVSALWSADGQAWQRATFEPQPVFEEDGVRAVAAGPSGFLAVGEVWPLHAEAWFSPDGLNWSRVGPDTLPEGTLNDVVVLPDGAFLAVGTDRSAKDWNAMAWRVSADGRRWLKAAGPEAFNGPQDDSLTHIWRGSGGFLARGLEEDTEQRLDCGAMPRLPTAALETAWVCGIDERQFVYTSPDGSLWQRQEGLAEPGELVGPPPVLWELTAVDRWGDGFIAVGAGTDWQIRVWLSDDGSSWQPIGQPIAIDGRLPSSGQDDSITGLAVAGDTLVVTGWGDSPGTQGFVLLGRTASAQGRP